MGPRSLVGQPIILKGNLLTEAFSVNIKTGPLNLGGFAMELAFKSRFIQCQIMLIRHLHGLISQCLLYFLGNVYVKRPIFSIL